MPGHPDPALELRLILAYRAGDRDAGGDLCKMHRYFIRKLALYYQRVAPHNEGEDYMQVGAIGLLDAAKDYEPARGTKFLSYAGWHIRRRMQDLTKSGLIYVPLTTISNLERCSDLLVHQSTAARNLNHIVGRDELDDAHHRKFWCSSDMDLIEGAEEWEWRDAYLRSILEYWAALEWRTTRRFGRCRANRRAPTIIATVRRWYRVVSLKIRGATYNEAARQCGVSRQRAHQLCQRVAELAIDYRKWLSRQPRGSPRHPPHGLGDIFGGDMVQVDRGGSNGGVPEGLADDGNVDAGPPHLTGPAVP